MPIQYLLLYASVRIPNPAGLITTCCDDLVTLWIELDFRYFILVAFEKRCACSCKYIIDSCQSVCARCCKLIASIVECGVENFVIMSFECLYTLPRSNVP